MHESKLKPKLMKLSPMQTWQRWVTRNNGHQSFNVTSFQLNNSAFSTHGKAWAIFFLRKTCDSCQTTPVIF